MTILGKITITLSDDPRYEAGKQYDVVLNTGQTPEPASLVTGELEPTTSEVAPGTGPLQ